MFIKPWGFYFDGNFYRGRKSKLSSVCSTCHHKQCLEFNSSERCSEGFVPLVRRVNDHKLVVPGVSNDRRIKNAIAIQMDAFNSWFKDFSSIIFSYDVESQYIISDTLHHFHDPVKLAEQIRINSEKQIENRSGNSFQENYLNAPAEIKAVYQSAKMLVDSIGMLEVFFNPESASFGVGKKTSIYKLIDKIQTIIYHSEGKKNNKKFRLNGSSFREIILYDSFTIVPFSLIHNAIKYSKEREIEITINDAQASIDVSVTSVGPYISESEKLRIFDKGFRGRFAKNLHHDGAGMGLYAAQEVAKVHGFQIRVCSRLLNFQQNDIDMAENIFSFSVPIAGVR